MIGTEFVGGLGTRLLSVYEPVSVSLDECGRIRVNVSGFLWQQTNTQQYLRVLACQSHKSDPLSENGKGPVELCIQTLSH